MNRNRQTQDNLKTYHWDSHRQSCQHRRHSARHTGALPIPEPIPVSLEEHNVEPAR